MSSTHTAFATCPKGLESLLLGELCELGALETKETVAGIHFEASLAVLYGICLWSRLANRIHLRLTSFDFHSEVELYEGALQVEWDEHLSPDATFSVDCTGTSGGITDTRFGALRVKDAVADYFRERIGRRPSVNTASPDIRLRARLHNSRATLSLDLSGESLHRRGYRTEGGVAPLKENLASALLLRANWPEIASGGGALIDPLCGSGTLLVEACHMAMGIAPGLARDRWGFDAWLGHIPKVWRDLREQAQTQCDAAMSDSWPDLVGYDADSKALHNARRNIERAGLSTRIKVYHKPLAELSRPTHKPFKPGLVLSNPPYGVRLGNEAGLVSLYRTLGTALKTEFLGWQAGVITGNPELGKTMGLRAHKQYRFYNGPIPSRLLLFDIAPAAFVGPPTTTQIDPCKSELKLSKGSEMFANRLKKNLKRLKKWRERTATQCYRLYDADMPEYAVAVDIYADWVHVAEYQAPAGVAEEAADQRLRDVLFAIPQVLDVPAEQVVLKQRRKQRGREQYTPSGGKRELLEVREGEARLQVNLKDYLDTGLFLDHRLLRVELGQRAKDASFLNLFCYTATATVHAALGGAARSTSVDMSTTYLDWARRNLRLNAIDESAHVLVRANCLQWLKEHDERYDIILLDPPTFSNSKRMEETFDVQRDHDELVRDAMGRLAENGLLVFTTHRRRFDLSPGLAEDFVVEDASRTFRDEDFSRSRQTHSVLMIRHAASGSR